MSDWQVDGDGFLAKVDGGSSTPTQPATPQQPAGVKTVFPTSDKLTVNGTPTNPTVYRIGGSNYFKLRDLGEALDFYVGYSGGQVTIDTGKGYSK